jgi:hypothetical protein
MLASVDGFDGDGESFVALLHFIGRVCVVCFLFVADDDDNDDDYDDGVCEDV